MPATTATLDDARLVLEAGSRLLADAVAAAKERTEGGRRIDDHQVTTERVAYAATEAVAAHEMLEAHDAVVAEGRSTPQREHLAIAAVGDLIHGLRDRLSQAAEDLGIGDAAVEAAFPAEVRSAPVGWDRIETILTLK